MSRALGSRYTLEESIARGAMGEVFHGTDDRGQALAFKLLHAELARDPELVERFVKERSILLSLRGENLVQVRDLVIEGDTLAIVMDLVLGGDLRGALRKHGPFAPAEVCRIGAGIARGLAEVHASGIVHRDIKPANILLDGPDGAPVPKVSDFGISSLIDDAHMRSTTIVGTPQYIAPEVAAGRSAIPASDLYALGIVLYELAVGVTPFAGGSVMAVLLRHGNTMAARPEGIPDRLWDVISRLLEKDPALRPDDAHAIAGELDDLRTELAGLPAAPGLTRPLEPIPRLDTTPGPAVDLPGPVTGPAVALAPPPPLTVATGADREPARTSFLPPNPPGPGLVQAYAAISDPVDPPDSFSSLEARGGAPAHVADGPAVNAPVIKTAGTNAQGPDDTSAAGSRTALFVVLGTVLALVLVGGGVLFWFLNGDRKPSPPIPDPTIGQSSQPGTQPGTTPSTEPDTTPETTPEVTPPDTGGQPEAVVVDGGPGAWRNFDGAVLRGKTQAHAEGAMICTGGAKSGAVEYALDGKYSKLTGVAGLPDSYLKLGPSAYVEIQLDNQVYAAHTLSEFSSADWDIDIKGVETMRLEWQEEACGTVGPEGVPLVVGSLTFTP